VKTTGDSGTAWQLTGLPRDATNKLQKTVRLFFDPFRQFVIGQLSVNELFETVADENPAGVDVSVAISSDLLEMLDGSKAFELARRDAKKCTGATFEALRVWQHVDEQLYDSGVAAVVFGDDEDDAVGSEKPVNQFRYACGLVFVGRGLQSFRRQLSHIQQVHRMPTLLVRLCYLYREQP